ncbi:hypothetical protein FHS36_005184 [Streptomyces eurocidicus]|uniref:Uncharacterized protein n=1 Tax=Streptomyces eurocidicus TaxID=66423 RepID=A0A7W8F5A1_STREU|nr:hypothetical protein [Streptomyces eurocidicus]
MHSFAPPPGNFTGPAPHGLSPLPPAFPADCGPGGPAAGGMLTGALIAKMLRPHSDLHAWRLAEVLRAYPTCTPEAQASSKP